jgi:2-polyprenyl-3-methyl-5-hydroxy-6-metoxy-1,4-benzoquinol methylase
MLPYTDAANQDLLDRIPLDAKILLDVGCGNGALGAGYKRRNPAALYLGIDSDEDAAHAAAARLDRVARVDVEVEPLPFDCGPIDCIIYGDILEHLRDPWSVLRRQAEALSENGTVLICMPNVEHWSLVDRLLRGAWDYEEQGLLDRTHLRWFNLETTHKAIVQAGLVAHDVALRIFDMDRAQHFVAQIRPGLEALGITPENYLRRAAPLQHLWRARRTARQRLHVVSTMLDPIGGVSEVRVIEPLRAIGTDSSVVTRIVTDLKSLELPPETPRIFIVHRPALLGEASLAPIRRLLDLGYIVVCEFDDHPEFIPILQRPDVLNFRAVHAVQTTTEPLAALFRRDNPEVAVFANAISQLPQVCNHATPGRLSLFFGGLNRETDWPPFMPALNAVAAVAGERLHFQVVNDQGFFDALQTPHKSFTPLCDYQTYLGLLAGSEISFMPLLDTPFNRAKSDLKFLEAAAARVAALASPVVYGASIENGRTGLLFDNARDLQQKLMRLVANPELAQVMGDAARAFVARHKMLAYQVAERNAWYRSLWARRDALRRDLFRRVPELARPGEAIEA